MDLNYHPRLSPKAIIATSPRSLAPHVISNGSPSRILSVRRISLGITTLPNSSILRTIPVARIVSLPPCRRNGMASASLRRLSLQG